VKRIVLGLEYDGTSWHGWQTQPDGHTVQDRLEMALREFTQGPVAVTCAGRTDSGVHALEQVVHFDTACERELFSWVRGLNALLPSSIAVHWAHALAPTSEEPFHARFSARERTYCYLLHNDPVRSPLLAGRAGWSFRPLEVARMEAAAHYLVGTHDYSAFRSSQCQAKSPVRTLHELRIERRRQMIVFTLRANAFLHHMVRNIIGSLLQVGSGKQSPEWLQQVLQQCDRNQAAPTFMPDGLYLAKVDYDAKWGLPQQQHGISLQ
jgi:tRNA pseudouridine38-40 synthase